MTALLEGTSRRWLLINTGGSAVEVYGHFETDEELGRLVLRAVKRNAELREGGDWAMHIAELDANTGELEIDGIGNAMHDTAQQMASGRFYVEWLTAGGWEDAGWTEDDIPMRFETRDEAQAEIDDHIRMCNDAVKRGDMKDGHSADEFRVVELPEDEEEEDDGE